MEIEFSELVNRIDKDNISRIVNDGEAENPIRITIFGFIKLANLNPKNVSNIISDYTEITESLSFRWLGSCKVAIDNGKLNPSIRRVKYIDSKLRIHEYKQIPMFINPKLGSIKISSFVLDTISFWFYRQMLEKCDLNFIRTEDIIVVEDGNILNMKTIAKSKRLEI